jgi:hypothetical protein
MAFKPRAGLRSVILNNQLTIPGHAGTWHRGEGAIRSILIEVADLVLYQNTWIDGETVLRGLQIGGSGTISEDKLALAGWGDNCRTLTVIIKVEAEAAQAWRAVVGFSPSDWELRSEDEWSCEIWIPQSDFDDMVAAYRSNELKHYTIGLKTELWMEDGHEHTPGGFGVTWYLIPPEREGILPQSAWCTVSTLGWRDHDPPVLDEGDQSTDILEPTSKPEPFDPALIVANFERLRITILQVGLLIAAAIVILWFAKR